MKKLGKVIHVDDMCIKIKVINTNREDEYVYFFHELKGFNKSLKEGDYCKLFYRLSILSGGFFAYRATKIKHKV